MYKAILCDDDEIIAQGLSALIPWNTLDICLCGTYNDGLAAKKALDREAIDIVISDIRMPFLDGLEITRLAKEQRPETKIILISGYDDFRYAREALKLGASDYLLKPINEEELIALLKRTVEQLQVQKQQESILSYGETSKRVDMHRCLAYEGNSSFVNRFGEAALGELEGRQCVAVVSLIDEYENFAQRYNRDEIQDIDQDFRRCVENPEFPLTVIEKFGGNIVSILQASSAAGVLHARQQYCDRLHVAFRTLYPALSVTIAASAAHPCAELQTAFTEMSQAIKERFVRPAGSDIFYESIDLNVNAQKNSLDNVAIVNAIISAIRLGDRVECEREIALLQQKLSLIGAESIMLMRLLVGNIFLSVIKDLQQYGINLREMGIDYVQEYQNTSSQQTLDAAMKEMLGCIMRIIDAVERNRQKSNTKAIAQACEYIEAHYTDHMLVIDEVAEHVHFSPSYFSVIFKRETGQSFTDYLIKLRIRKSQDLMLYSDLKIHQIATAVGYDTAAYYSTAFKKETGMSPIEYKKQHLQADRTQK